MQPDERRERQPAARVHELEAEELQQLIVLSASAAKAKKRAAQSASVASDAPTERDFDDDEFQSLLDQPATIPELGELEIDDDDDGAPPLGSDESWVKVS